MMAALVVCSRAGTDGAMSLFYEQATGSLDSWPHKQPIGIDAGGKLVPAVLLKVGSLVHWGKEVTSQYAEIHRWITNGGSSASDPNPAGLSYAVGTADFADCVTGLPLAVEDAHFAACSSWPGSCCSKPAALATCCPCVPATRAVCDTQRDTVRVPFALAAFLQHFPQVIEDEDLGLIWRFFERFHN